MSVTAKPSPQGTRLFSLLDSAQVAGVNVAESQLTQIASAFAQAEVQLEGAKATLTQAESAWRRLKTSWPKRPNCRLAANS